MEQAVEQHYGHAVRLPDDFRAHVRSAVDAAVATNHDLTDDMRDQYTRRLDKFDAKESYLLDLASEEGWPKDKLREKVQAIRHERKQIRQELDQAEQRLDTGRAIFHRALDLLDDPQATYQRGNETVRSILNKSFFTKLYVDGRKVADQELQEPFGLLSDAYQLYRDHRQHQQAPRTYRRQRAPQTHRTAALGRYGGSEVRSSLTVSLALTLRARGSSKAAMVDLLGRYSNRSDLLEQLKKVSVVLSQGGPGARAKPAGRVEVSEGSRSRWLRDRFSAGQLQAMIDLYRSGAPARGVAERYGVGVRSIKRLLQRRGVHRRDAG